MLWSINLMSILAITTTGFKSKDRIVDVDPNLRNCYFSHETKATNLSFHKFYTQDNCLLECRIKTIQVKSYSYYFKLLIHKANSVTANSDHYIHTVFLSSAVYLSTCNVTQTKIN